MGGVGIQVTALVGDGGCVVWWYEPQNWCFKGGSDKSERADEEHGRLCSSVTRDSGRENREVKSATRPLGKSHGYQLE